MSFTAKEVQDAISAFEDSDEFEDDGWESGILHELKGEGRYNHSDDPYSKEVPGLGKLEFVDDYGGEGQGDDYWVVFKVGDQYFRQDGWYASHDGGYLDGELYEVEPVEVTRTEYQVKK